MIDYLFGPRRYSDEDYATFLMLFGPCVNDVLSKVTLRRSWFLNCCEFYDDGSIEIYHTFWGWLMDYVKVHEFTHAVCFYRWPRSMMRTATMRAEAAAFLGVAMWRVLNARV